MEFYRPTRPGDGFSSHSHLTARFRVAYGRPPGRRDAMVPAMREVPIRGDGIRLGQLLKLAGVVDSGGEAKDLLEMGDVRVNDEPEQRRGRQLGRGDVVTVAGERLRVA